MLDFHFMTNDVTDLNTNPRFRRDVFIISLFFIFVAVVGFYDVYEDWVENVSREHLIFEGIVNVLELLAGTYLFLRVLKSNKMKVHEIRTQYLEARKSATTYKEQVDKFKEGVTEAISKQFKTWELTQAEEEICLFLLKGFSLQEIAEFRNTSERTIRQQASNMYKKTGLTGRAQLSAFFLEDMLTPKAA